MTLAGLAAGRAYPAGLPPGLGALSKQVAAAGPCLGFLSLGFAVAAMRGTSSLEVRHYLLWHDLLWHYLLWHHVL